MKRLAIGLLSLALLAAPLAAAAQQASTRRIGFLAAGSAATTRDWIVAFERRLRELVCCP